MNLISDALTPMVPLLAAPLTALLCGVLYRLMTKLGLQATAQDRANMNGEIRAAIGAGLAALPSVMADGILTPKGAQDVIEAATAYMHKRFPDRVAQIVAGTTDGATSVQAVRTIVAARLINIIVSSPSLAAPGGVASASVLAPAPTLPPIPPGGALPL